MNVLLSIVEFTLNNLKFLAIVIFAVLITYIQRSARTPPVAELEKLLGHVERVVATKYCDLDVEVIGIATIRHYFELLAEESELPTSFFDSRVGRDMLQDKIRFIRANYPQKCAEFSANKEDRLLLIDLDAQSQHVVGPVVHDLSNQQLDAAHVSVSGIGSPEGTRYRSF